MAGYLSPHFSSNYLAQITQPHRLHLDLLRCLPRGLIDPISVEPSAVSPTPRRPARSSAPARTARVRARLHTPHFIAARCSLKASGLQALSAQRRLVATSSFGLLIPRSQVRFLHGPCSISTARSGSRDGFQPLSRHSSVWRPRSSNESPSARNSFLSQPGPIPRTTRPSSPSQRAGRAGRSRRGEPCAPRRWRRDAPRPGRGP